MLKSQILEDFEAGGPTCVRKKYKAKHPAVDDGVSEFVSFIRSQRLLVSMRMIQERALSIAEYAGIADFKASSGWLQKFLRRSGTQNSIRLLDKRSSALSVDHEERMEHIRNMAAVYDLENTYNQNESGLLYRLGPNRSYFTGNEIRSNVRGTSVSKA